MRAHTDDPIGIFDSGVGGLSVLRHLRAQLPAEHLLYVADQVHVPYGARSAAEIRQLSEAITRSLLAQRAKLIVVACNTASGAALSALRRRFPSVPFVGMEPAVKPAATQTKSGKVGVLATTGTFESQRYDNLMTRFAGNVTVLEDPCLGLVELVEAGAINTPDTRTLLQRCLAPMLATGVDTLVLGCTHYPFVMPLIRQIAGKAVSIIDPAPAVARQALRLLQQHRLQNVSPHSGEVFAYTTADPQAFSRLAQRLLDFQLIVKPAIWRDDRLLLAA